MPTIPLDQYSARKEAAAQFSKSTFAMPAGLELSTAGSIRAPEARTPLAATPTLSWEGIPKTSLTPPSPEIAVGPDDVILVVNSAVARYTRDGKQTAQIAFSDWFSGIFPTVCPGGAGQCLIFDPSVRYDQLHGRFLLSATSHDFQANSSHLLLSVSNGATYAGGWKHWATDARFDGTTPTGNWADFPRLGFDAAAVYLTPNMYSVSGMFQYAKLRILKKSELYDPKTTSLTYQDIFKLKNEDGTWASSIQPPHVRGRVGYGVPSAFFVNASDTAHATYLTVWSISQPTGSNPTAKASTIGTLWSYDYPAPAPQLGGSATIDSGDTRVLKAVLREGILYTGRNTGYSDQASTVTFDRIDTSTMKATLQARLTNSNSFYPALDIPATLGVINAFPNKLLAGTTTLPDGSLCYPGIAEAKPGVAYYLEGTGKPSRWGDYNGAAIDPLFGGLWVYGEYSKSMVSYVSQWGTWAAYYPWSTAQVFTDVASTSPYFDYVNVMSLWGLTAGCVQTPLKYCPGDPVTRGQASVFVIRGLFGDTFTSPSTAFFTDVKSSDPIFPYVQKMKELGITTGCDATRFCPDQPMSRSQMAVFLIRAKFGALFGDKFSFPSTAYFKDVEGTDVMYPFIQKLRELAITTGCAADRYCPDDPVTREQMAAFVVRAFLN